ncbi:8809_t:CDS:10, partial [Acaulospora morrowiae]
MPQRVLDTFSSRNMDYKVPAHVEIDTYFSAIPISKWHLLDVYINFKLEDGLIHTAKELYRTFCRSLACIERGGYPKFVTEYVKNLKMFMKLAEKIIERVERRQLMKENEIDIQEKQTRKNYVKSARKRSNGMSEYTIKTDSKQIFTWDHAIPRMEIKEASMKDWINDEHNFSDYFRKFQKSIIEKLKTDPTLSYATDIESIVVSTMSFDTYNSALSSIMILRKNKKPIYVSCTENEWRMAFPHITYKFKIPVLIQVTVCSYMQPLMRGDSTEFEDLWRQNWSKVSLLEDQSDKRIFDSMQIITRNFFYNLPYGKNKNLSNEDTYVHRTCHVILEEIFRIENMQLVWANGESSSSKSQRSGDGNAHGLKPDLRLISEDENQSEILFGEIKPPKVENHKFVVNQALAKLANLMKDALDQGIYDETYGVLINGNRIEFWRITLNYDGLYQFMSLVEMTFPTEVAEFLVILSVMERCYELKELVIKTEQRSMKNGSSQLSVNYQRDSNSNPVKTK